MSCLTWIYSVHAGAVNLTIWIWCRKLQSSSIHKTIHWSCAASSRHITKVRRHLILGKRDSLSNSDTQTLFWDKEYTFLDKVSTLPRSHFWKEYMNMYSFWPRFTPAVRQRDGRGRLVSRALKTEVCRGPVELHCEGGNHARDCILVLFYSRLSLNRVFFPSKMLATY